MPQPQMKIPLHFVNGSGGEAVASGNNAAWHCLCKKVEPLLGHTCSGERPESDRVDCVCGRKFYVIGEGPKRFTKAIEVVELG